MAETAVPEAPDGMGASGRALWAAVMANWELEQHEQTLLREACRTADSLDGLQSLLDAEGLTSSSSQGTRVAPALVELRHQRIAFARLMTALRVPIGEAEDRGQSRGGPRGVYGVVS